MTWQPSRRGALVLILAAYASPSTPQANAHPIILHAAHLLDVETGRLQTPAEVRIEGERIVAVGAAVEVTWQQLDDEFTLPVFRLTAREI